MGTRTFGNDPNSVRSEPARHQVGESVSEREDDRALDRSVLALAREIADTINAGPIEGREVLREMAVNAVRDHVQIVVPPRLEARKGDGGFNPLGIGIPLVLVGAVLIVFFPPVGVLMFAIAAVMVIWGVLATLVGRR